MIIIIAILIFKLQTLSSKTQQLEKIILLERKGFRRLIAYEKKTAKFKHDLRNQMLGIEYLLKTEKTDAGINHLMKLVHNFHALECDFSSANYIWNILIDYKISEYCNEAIEIIRDINLQNIGHIDEVDFCIILGNLLDNAFKGVLTAENRKIRIVLTQDKGFVYMEINNTCRNTDSIKPIHKIEEFVEHGFGLQNVQELVHTYGGKMEIEKKPSLFSIRIIIPNLAI